jgi:hypothetical protein
MTGTSEKEIDEALEATNSSKDLMSEGEDIFKSPFIGWSPETVYKFFTSHIQGPQGAAAHANGFSQYTLLILDSQSAPDRSILVCSDAPDIGETADQIVLKTIRMLLADIGMMCTIELLLMAPSEWDKEIVMKVNPPAFLNMIEIPQSSGKFFGTIATPRIARRNKRAGLGQIDLEAYRASVKTRLTGMTMG